MENLPEKYRWLEKEQGPKMLVEMLKIYGTVESPGAADNPTILSWAKELDLKEYNHDSIPWCGLCMAVAAKRAGKPVVKNPLWAANWLNSGNKVYEAMLGDVVVFKRPGGNHVGLYVGEDSTCYHIIGGNQGDRVSIMRILKSRMTGIRRPIYTVAQPVNVRKITLSSSGNISANEQ
jgi:uncharacterized protein (TIGR02594 family)